MLQLQLEKMSQVKKVLRKQGKWSPLEDELLLNSVNEYKKLHNFKKGDKIIFSEVVRKVVGRTAKQAQERWDNHVRPDLKRGEWSEEETTKLLDSIGVHGQDWSKIARKIETRGFHGIKVKGKTLLKELVPKRRAAKLLKQGKVMATKENAGAWSPSDRNLLIKLHIEEKASFEVIVEKLSVIRSEAEIEREVLKICQCEECVLKKQEIASLGSDFKSSWSKVAAKHLRRKMRDDASCTSGSTEYDSDKNTNKATGPQKRKVDNHSPSNNTPCILPRNNSNHLNRHQFASVSKTNANILTKRSSTTASSSLDDSSDGSDQFRKDITRYKSSRSSLPAFMDVEELEFLLNADVGDEKDRFLEGIEKFQSNPELQDFVEAFTKYHSAIYNRLLNSSKLYGNLSLSNPFLSHMLHSKFNKQSCRSLV